MTIRLETAESSDTVKASPMAGFDSLQTFRMPESLAFNPSYSGATMLAFDGNNGFALFDSGKGQARAGSRERSELDPGGDKNEKPSDHEHERGEDDVRWVNELMGAQENNAAGKDIKAEVLPGAESEPR